MAQARRDKIDWVLHIDADELLHLRDPPHQAAGAAAAADEGGKPAMQRLAELFREVPEDASVLWFPNYEAEYPAGSHGELANCFVQTSVFNTAPSSFRGYEQGKVAGRLSDQSLQPAGPHMFSSHRMGKNGGQPFRGHLNIHRILWDAPYVHVSHAAQILHFESCPFSAWQKKFERMADTPRDQEAKIPFPFYKESIEASRRCSSSKGGDKDAVGEQLLRDKQEEPVASGCSSTELFGLYDKWTAVPAGWVPAKREDAAAGGAGTQELEEAEEEEEEGQGGRRGQKRLREVRIDWGQVLAVPGGAALRSGDESAFLASEKKM